MPRRFRVGFGTGRLGDLLGLFRTCHGVGDPAGGVVSLLAVGACGVALGLGIPAPLDLIPRTYRPSAAVAGGDGGALPT